MPAAIPAELRRRRGGSCHYIRQEMNRPRPGATPRPGACLGGRACPVVVSYRRGCVQKGRISFHQYASRAVSQLLAAGGVSGSAGVGGVAGDGGAGIGTEVPTGIISV